MTTPLRLLSELRRTELFGIGNHGDVAPQYGSSTLSQPSQTSPSLANREETECGQFALELASLRTELEAALSQESDGILQLEEQLREERDERMETRQLLVEANEHASELESAFLKLTLECAEAKELSTTHQKRAAELERRLDVAVDRARRLETQVRDLTELISELCTTIARSPARAPRVAVECSADVVENESIPDNVVGTTWKGVYSGEMPEESNKKRHAPTADTISPGTVVGLAASRMSKSPKSPKSVKGTASSIRSPLKPSNAPR
jgi:hypothetical protein